MKGLLLKDWYVLTKQSRFMLLLLLFYVVLSATGSESFGGFAVIFVSMLPMTLMGIDEKNKWENLAVTMPYHKKDIVISRYLLLAGMLMVLSFVYLCIQAVQQLVTTQPGAFLNITYITIMLSLGLVYPAVCLPFMFLVGVEKGRLLFIGITAVIGGAAGGFLMNYTGESMKVLSSVMNKSWLIIVIDILLFLLSASISVRIYERREF